MKNKELEINNIIVSGGYIDTAFQSDSNDNITDILYSDTNKDIDYYYDITYNPIYNVVIIDYIDTDETSKRGNILINLLQKDVNIIIGYYKEKKLIQSSTDKKEVVVIEQYIKNQTNYNGFYDFIKKNPQFNI